MPDSKSGEGASLPWVRIPPSPPLSLTEQRLFGNSARRSEKTRDSAGFWVIGFAQGNRRPRVRETVHVAPRDDLRSQIGRFPCALDSPERRAGLRRKVVARRFSIRCGIPCAQVGSSADVPQSNPSCAVCSAQSSGRSTCFVSSWVVSSTGWVPERMLATTSGAKKTSGIRLAT